MADASIGRLGLRRMLTTVPARQSRAWLARHHQIFQDLETFKAI